MTGIGTCADDEHAAPVCVHWSHLSWTASYGDTDQRECGMCVCAHMRVSVCACAYVCEISESHKHRAILEALFACRLSAELFLLINIQAMNKE